MAKPKGCPLYGMHIATLAGIPVSPGTTIPHRSINCSLIDWQSTGVVVTVNYNAVTSELTLIAPPIPWPCIERKTHLYWQECIMPGCSPLAWNYHSKDNWSINPAPPGVQLYVVVIDLTDLLPLPLDFSLLFVCGPHPAHLGIPPKVTGVTPV